MQVQKLELTSAKSACCPPEQSWKSPKLSSAPAGMAAGLNVTAGRVPCAENDTTCKKPCGEGSEEQKLPEVTIAGMPYSRRSFCRTAVSSNFVGLMVSVAGPLSSLTSVNDAVLIVPGAGAGLGTRVRPRAGAVAPAATGRPATAASRCGRCRDQGRLAARSPHAADGAIAISPSATWRPGHRQVFSQMRAANDCH